MDCFEPNDYVATEYHYVVDMSDRPTEVDGVPNEVLDRIRERVLAKEQEQRDYKMVHGLRPELKDIIEQEITKNSLD